jgi:hypothetical protein
MLSYNWLFIYNKHKLLSFVFFIKIVSNLLLCFGFVCFNTRKKNSNQLSVNVPMINKKKNIGYTHFFINQLHLYS